MSNNGYTVRENLVELKESILEDLSQGYDLVDVAYSSDGTWVGTFQDTPGLSSYITASNTDELGQTVQEQWTQGYRLTDVEYGDGVWFGTLQEGSKANAYNFVSSLNELTEGIAGRWEEGYDLVDVEYGDGTWFGVFQDDSSITSGYVSGSTFDELLGNFQQQFGSQGYELVDVEYGNGAWLGVTEKEVPQNAFENPALYPLAVALEEQKTAIMVDVLSFNDFDIPW